MIKRWLPLLCLLSACAGSNKSKISPTTGVPDCILQKIDEFKRQPVQNPPRSVYSFIYSDSIVYYIPSICCDQFSDLYDGNCLLLGHPDGGFIGKGDGKVNDFSTTKTGEKIIWKDSRSK